MSVDQMRYSISNAYPGIRWKNYVQRMDDKQVIAVYYNLLESGKLAKTALKKDSPKQYSLFDENYISSINGGTM